jgi:tetratricopeptide (TPR) repeat protein
MTKKGALVSDSGIDPRGRLCYFPVVAKALEKELKQPDEFVSFWTHFGQKLSRHKRTILGLLAVVGVSGGAGWGVTAYKHGVAAKATVAFDRIERIAQADLLPEKAPDKAAAKDDPKPEDDGLPHFKTEKERLEAANKEADAFLAEFGQTAIGRKAMFNKAGRLLVLGNAAEAANIYTGLIAGETDRDLRLLQQEGVAIANEAQGKLDEALRGFASLAEESQRGSKFYLDRVLYAQARILEKQGKGKDAEKILREILEKVPKTSLRSQIDDRLALVAEK